MMRKYILKIILTLVLINSEIFAFSTDQPIAEPHADLRSHYPVFSVEMVESGRFFFLEKTANGEYFLRQRFKDEDHLLKIAGREASRIDRAFSANFLSCQFEIPETDGECKVTLRLKLHGDGIQLCLKDEQKTRKMNSFIDAELMPHFLKN
jgi:hypothetical protein